MWWTNTHTRPAFVRPASLAAIKHSTRDLKLALLCFYFSLVGRNVYMPVVYFSFFHKADKVNVWGWCQWGLQGLVRGGERRGSEGWARTVARGRWMRVNSGFEGTYRNHRHYSLSYCHMCLYLTPPRLASPLPIKASQSTQLYTFVDEKGKEK